MIFAADRFASLDQIWFESAFFQCHFLSFLLLLLLLLFSLLIDIIFVQSLNQLFLLTVGELAGVPELGRIEILMSLCHCVWQFVP